MAFPFQSVIPRRTVIVIAGDACNIERRVSPPVAQLLMIGSPIALVPRSFVLFKLFISHMVHAAYRTALYCLLDILALPLLERPCSSILNHTERVRADINALQTSHARLLVDEN